MVRPATSADKVEDDIVEDLYRYLRGTNFAADIFRKWPDKSPDELAKIMSVVAMDGKVGKYVKQLTNDCPRFKKTAKNALYRAFLRCLTEYKQKGG